MGIILSYISKWHFAFHPDAMLSSKLRARTHLSGLPSRQQVPKHLTRQRDVIGGYNLFAWETFVLVFNGVLDCLNLNWRAADLCVVSLYVHSRMNREKVSV